MQSRIEYTKLSSQPYLALVQLEKYLHDCGLEPQLLHLIKLRASQINGCAYCLDMHSKDLLAGGDTVQRLVGLDGWRESPFYSDRERAALEWTEALTLIADTHAEDEIYQRVKPHFTDKELVDLTWAIATINAWNRVAISMRSVPGTYQPPKKAQREVV